MDDVRDAKIASIFKDGRYIHQDLIDLFPYVMEKGGIAVDAGAHVGTLAIPLARWASKVIAFEPGAETFSYLERNIALNQANVEARNKGLGETPARASVLDVSTGNAAANSLTLTGGDIVISTLDSEMKTADFVKIDVEGMELSVLRGGARLWKESKPSILFEVNLFALRAHGTEARDLQQFLSHYGYQLYYPCIYRGNLALGRVPSLTLIVLFFAPRSYIFRGPSAPFDVLALPHSHILSSVLPRIGALHMLSILLIHNLASKVERLTKLFD